MIPFSWDNPLFPLKFCLFIILKANIMKIEKSKFYHPGTGRNILMDTIKPERPEHRMEPKLEEFYDGETRMYKTPDGKLFNADSYDKIFKTNRTPLTPKKINKINRNYHKKGG
jgi:hypothetical protein